MSEISFQKVFKTLKNTSRSMDIQAAILRFNRNWNSIYTVMRFTYYEKKELLKINRVLEKKYPIPHINNFEIVSYVFDIKDFDQIKMLEAVRSSFQSGGNDSAP